MIAGLLLALQLVMPAGSLTVKSPDRESRIPVVVSAGIPAVRADLLALALDGSARHGKGAQWTVTLAGVALDVTAGAPFVRRGDETLQLVSSPYVEKGVLYLPLQLLAEVVPRLTTGLNYDADARELRRFAAVTTERDAGKGRQSAAAATAARAPSSPTGTAPKPAARRPRERVVVVDAGHGGPDRGMRGPIGGGPRIFEADITLAVATKYAEELRERGYKVVMTRTRDTLIALADRGRIANRNKGDLFVSVHVNAANPRWQNAAGARGYETFFLAEAKTEDERRVADMENEAVRFETEVETTSDDPLGFIVNDMAQNEHLRESNEVASVVQRHLGRVHPGPNRGVKQAGFKVLVTAFMPAVLVELGFGTNPAEARFLSSAARQRELARSLADATDEYFARYDRRVRATGS
ncbi:MAG TPA: N-acetylmuramoyl-L-alanine amidase [Gemmatimonadaceae bacterium]|nr:N-acetylmuramoyl-L-alanine amidase [Gemmatimonadaceae bacterium]